LDERIHSAQLLLEVHNFSRICAKKSTGIAQVPLSAAQLREQNPEKGLIHLGYRHG
jgi:hypothetical protein